VKENPNAEDGPKNMHTKLMVMILSNLNRFSKFFHWQILPLVHPVYSGLSHTSISVIKGIQKRSNGLIVGSISSKSSTQQQQQQRPFNGL